MTICVKCGASRRYIPDACGTCGFRPQSLRDLATAAVLTTQWIDGDDSENPSWGTEDDQLNAIARKIREGHHPALDEANLRRHESRVREFLEAGPTPPIAAAMFVVFRPAILFLGGLVVVWLLLRAMRTHW